MHNVILKSTYRSHSVHVPYKAKKKLHAFKYNTVRKHCKRKQTERQSWVDNIAAPYTKVPALILATETRDF
jgi:hypothetical protein